MQPRILVIDDEDSMCNFMKIMLSKEGFEVDSASSGMEGISFLKQKNYDLVIADMNMPGMTGIEVLKEVKSFRTDQELIVMTAYASVETAIDAMKHGARDYITKPFKLDELKIVINKSLSQKNLEQENTSLKKRLKEDNSFDKFIGVSEQVVKLKSYAKQVALADSTVLIRGESGTGKDLVAKAIHHNSPRSDGPLVTINCGALPENLLESELFGHKKGSFTGAIRDKDGLFKVADGGSLFLDEIGNVSIGMQVKLLRVLEDKLVTPVGETKPVKVDVRLIAATNSDLEEDVKAGRFREDLFYRLNVIPIDIPSLRERKEDISLLVKHFIQLHCQKSNSVMKTISGTALKLLSAYQWPGNVRELENTIERAVLLSKSDILKPDDFPQKISDPVPMNVISESKPETPTLESIEKAYIHFVMSQTEGKKTKAAKILGIDASTLYRKIERYKLKDDFDKNLGK
ncbi:MAG: hypothetical protein DRP35_11355 [Candidatus Zixiibacteriota bacterium]|nr:MAG: hypothetical protein DRP35_11355 [candidate division Zixibacteria bacterium]